MAVVPAGLLTAEVTGMHRPVLHYRHPQPAKTVEDYSACTHSL
jgi:hypothetical protein